MKFKYKSGISIPPPATTPHSAPGHKRKQCHTMMNLGQQGKGVHMVQIKKEVLEEVMKENDEKVDM
jgi:hypothetical protein